MSYCGQDTFSFGLRTFLPPLAIYLLSKQQPPFAETITFNTTTPTHAPCNNSLLRTARTGRSSDPPPRPQRNLTTDANEPTLTSILHPALYYHVDAWFQSHRRFLFDFTESTLAFAKNVHHVRQLELSRTNIVYYTNCVTVFLDLLATLLKQNTTAAIIISGNQPALSRPAWLAPPDPHICSVLPIPPMTMLTSLELDFCDRGEHWLWKILTFCLAIAIPKRPLPMPAGS